MSLFCSNCGCYFPSGAVCFGCQTSRALPETPATPDRPVWLANVPGAVAENLSLAKWNDDTLVVVPWNILPERDTNSRATGGITLLRLSDGTKVWERSLDALIESGAAVTGDMLIVGMRSSAGEGSLVGLGLGDGQIRWGPVSPEGAVRSAPVVDEARIFVTASDGKLYCFDLGGRRMWVRPVMDRAVQIHASPVVHRDRRGMLTILVVTYSGQFGRVPARLAAFDAKGDMPWSPVALEGNARGTPLLAGQTLYVTTYGEHPSRGFLHAYNVHDGRPVWSKPFVVSPKPGHQNANFSASPCVHNGMVYAGSLNRSLYALDAANGQLKWEREADSGIVTAPAWVEGLVVVGANDGQVYAFDALGQSASGEPVWKFALAAPARTNPLVVQDFVLAGAQNGEVALLPWHLGKYAWAAERMEQQHHPDRAAEFHALAALYEPNPVRQAKNYERASEHWQRAGSAEKSGEMWLALDQRAGAAGAFYLAAEQWRPRDARRAARYFKRAADLYFELRDENNLNRATRALALCAGLPIIHAQTLTVPRFIQWQQGRFTLRLTNQGNAPIPRGVRLFLGGAIESWIEATIGEVFLQGTHWNIPLSLVATTEESVLEIEVEYDPGSDEFGLFHELHRIPIRAVPPPTPPANINFGDVGKLEMVLQGTTAEGLKITTRDIGAVISRGNVGSVEAQGDIGLVRGDHVVPQMRELRDLLTQLLASQTFLANALAVVYERQDEYHRHVVWTYAQAVHTHRVQQQEMHEAYEIIQSALAEIRRDAHIQDEMLRAELQAAVRAAAATAEVEHQLIVTLPIVPLLLEYQTKLSLAGQVRLRELWARLVARVERGRP